MSASHNQAVFALYKTFFRQTRKLPHLYLRQVWRIKAFDDVRAILASDNVHGIRNKKISRMRKDLRKIEAANNRDVKAFEHVLDIAYGRKGKLKRETIEPVLVDPTAPKPPPIIPAVEKSRPPVYSAELKALLMSPHSRTTRPLSQKELDFPTTLPARANPASDDAWLLGPLSKRRETNIRWRYFVAEWKKVRTPLQVVVASGTDVTSSGVTVPEDIQRAGIRGLSMQGLHVFEDVEDLVGPRWIDRPWTRREYKNSNVASPAQAHTRHPSRWIRRRYQGLLNRLPILTYSVRQKDSSGGSKAGTYSVSLSPKRSDKQTNPAVADPLDLEWL